MIGKRPAKLDRNGVWKGAFDGTQAVDGYCLCARHPCCFGQSRNGSRLGQRAGLAWRLGRSRLLLAWRRLGLASSRLGLASSWLGLARRLGLGSLLGLGSRLGLARRLGLGPRMGLDLALGCLRHRVAISISNSCNWLHCAQPSRRRNGRSVAVQGEHCCSAHVSPSVRPAAQRIGRLPCLLAPGRASRQAAKRTNTHREPPQHVHCAAIGSIRLGSLILTLPTRSFRKRQSVPSARIFCGLDLMKPNSCRRSA